MSIFEVELLGSPVFKIDSLQVAFTRKKAKALMMYMVCTERKYTREELAELFWPTYPLAKAMGSLRTIISEVKTLFHGELLRTEGDSLYLDKTSLCCDLLIFRKILSHPSHLSDMRNAAELWKGGFLKGFHIDSLSGFSDWQMQEEQNIFCEYKQLLRSLYEQETEKGDLPTALSHARTCLSLDNFDEETHRAVIFIYALIGERKLALEQYETCRRIMRKEFQSPLEDKTQVLAQQIRSGEIGRITLSEKRGSHIPRLAILPFQSRNLFDHETLLFIDMTMEALEDFFVGSPALKIISRTSTLIYKDSEKRMPIIAAELQADYVIEGFFGLHGTTLLIEGRLVETKQDIIRAVKKISITDIEDQNPANAAKEMGNCLSIPLCINDCSGLSIDETSGNLRKSARVKQISITEKLKLQAKHLLRTGKEDTCLQAIKLFKKAAQLDPSDAEAWAGAGLALLSYSDKEICCPNRTDTLSDAQDAAEKALTINAEEPTALNILGNISVQKEWDFIKAEELYRKSLDILPNNPRVLRDFAELCILTGRYEESRKLSESANELDPVSHQNFKIRFWLHLVLKEYHEAKQIVQQHFLLFPAPTLEHIMVSYIHLILDDVESAFDTLDSVRGEIPLAWENSRLGAQGYAYAQKGLTEKAHEAIRLLENNQQGPVHPHLPIALSYTGLRDYQNALTWIESAVKIHDPALFFLAVNPLFASLNAEPRLQEILLPTHIVPVRI